MNFKKLILGFTLSCSLFFTAITSMADQVDPTANISHDDIVILYENDVHNRVDGYPVLKQMEQDFLQKTPNVAIVSAGDFAQGATIGAISKGEHIINIMNNVGYTAVTLGNHEFDYQIPQLKKLVKMLDAPVVTSNFTKKNKLVYKAYIIKDYNGTKIAFLGIATPESITKSTPKYFQNDKGQYIYDFASDNSGYKLYHAVQKYTDEAKSKGADYVIALAHLGTEGVTPQWSSLNVVKNTDKINAVLDGHSHSTIERMDVPNKNGQNVVLSSTGSYLKNIGIMVIKKDGTITTKLVSLKEYTKADPAVKKVVEDIKTEAKELLDKTIGQTEVNLTTKANGERMVRKAETNIGDFTADATRQYLGTDIAIINGGGIRGDINKGDISMNSLLTVFPWGNMLSSIEVKGKVIRDALEMGARLYPEENGGFLQVSGLKYTIDSSIPSSVEVDSKGMFKQVTGPYRVKDIYVLDKNTGEYLPLDIDKNYSVGGINYTLKLQGDGFAMFKNAKILKDDIAVDIESITDYLQKHLNGVVGDEYAKPKGLITII